MIRALIVDDEPLARERLRLRQKLSRPHVALQNAAPSSARLAFRLPSQIVFVRPEQVEWIAAEGNYSRVHVHRSAIINVDIIHKVVVDRQGRYTVVLHTRSGIAAAVNTQGPLPRASVSDRRCRATRCRSRRPAGIRSPTTWWSPGPLMVWLHQTDPTPCSTGSEG